jgi:hypothetical protein
MPNNVLRSICLDIFRQHLVPCSHRRRSHSHFWTALPLRMARRTWSTSLTTRRLETLLQVTLSDRIKDMHLGGCCISWSIADIARASMMAWNIVSLYH